MCSRPKGQHLRTFGGKGEGPGEFQFLRQLAALSDGRLAAWDRQSRRVTVFEDDDDARSTGVIQIGFMDALWTRMVGAFSDGSAIVRIDPSVSAMREETVPDIGHGLVLKRATDELDVHTVVVERIGGQRP